MKKLTYESPELVFTKTELFENVAEQCWANASLYCLVDPSDEDGCNDSMLYADLKNFVPKGNGCNANMMNEIRAYLLSNYGEGKTGKDHYLTDDDINTIFKSGGGNDGTPLKTSEYIIKVRS